MQGVFSLVLRTRENTSLHSCNILPYCTGMRVIRYSNITTNLHPSIHIIALISFSDLELGDELGKGRFGAVYKAYWKSTEMAVAVKRVPSKSHKGEVSYLASSHTLNARVLYPPTGCQYHILANINNYSITL